MVGRAFHLVEQLSLRLVQRMGRLFRFRNQLTEDRNRCIDINRLRRELKIYFPEYMEIFGKIDGAFALKVLKKSSMPEDILALGEDKQQGMQETAILAVSGCERGSVPCWRIQTAAWVHDKSR